jgi:hypothetical protein
MGFSFCSTDGVKHPKNVETKSTPLAGRCVGQKPKQQACEIDDSHNVILHRLNGSAEIG